MRRELSVDLTLYFKHHFPYVNSFQSTKSHTVIIGIGGNIGNVKKRFDKLFLALLSDARFAILKSSPLLKNPPFGYLDQDDFINAVMVLKTDLSAFESLKAFAHYENRYGRKRSFKDAPRTLDIDILFFDDAKINTNKLVIPHPCWHERDSVTIPLEYVR
ncbi:MAG: 2-amino-4-hydroxy-6-hydroxymethyldihydropteridine diphosphokinase [Campylobacterota bacterium]|nr:2-amino-4-hydroxy-6-hydroxymethyldihydropteridine diphosphokinase [Campylobacterota bacterium]